MSTTPSSVYGYDPARVVALRHRTVEAIDELAALRCDDPLAADAARIVRLLRHNLEDSWLPLIDAICSSRALVAWRTALRATLVGVAGWPVSIALPEALRTWIATTTLGHLADHELADRLGRAAGALLDRVRRGGELHDPLSELSEVVREARQRAEHDTEGSFGAVLAGALGPGGVEALIGVLGSLHGLVRAAHLVDDTTAEMVLADLARVVGELTAASDAARETLAASVARSPELGAAMIAHLDHFDGATVLAVTRHLVAAFAGLDIGTAQWGHAARSVDDASILDPLLERLAGEPVLALDLLSDDRVLRTIVLDDRLDPHAVEGVVAAGLAAPGVETGRTAEAFEVFAELVAVASAHELSVGARRGIARSFGVLLPVLAPHLDQRLPVDVTVRTGVDGRSGVDGSNGAGGSDGGTTVIALGNYGAVAGLLGQVADDEPAQLILGLVVGAFREEQLGRAAALLHDPDRMGDPIAARDLVAASLADVTRAVTLIDRGIDQRNRMLAFLHGSQRSALNTITGLLVNLVTWFAPGAPVSGRIATLSSRLISSALSETTPPRVPGTGVQAELATHFLVSAMALPVGDAGVRAALGLDGVDEAVWAEVADIVDDLERTDDPDERRRLHSRLRAAASADPTLDSYLELLSVTSGEAALG